MTDPPAAVHRSKAQLAQLVGEALIHAAPHTAKISSDETARQVNTWLDGLEAHTATLIAPFLQHVLDHSDPPDAVRALLVETMAPSAAFSATIGQIAAFSILSQVISIATAPFLQGVSNNLYGDAVGGHAARSVTDAAGNLITYAVPDGNDVARPVDPATIATATGRGLNLGDPPTVSVQDWAYKEAANQGIDAHNLNLMASIIGLPPALQELFEMHRRGIITIADVKRGLREGDFRDDWIDNAVGLIHAYLTPLDFVRAAVQEQMSYKDARDWAATTGLDVTTPVPVNVIPGVSTPDMFGLAYSIAGRPPGPQELAQMTHRKIIDPNGRGANMTTFEQGIAESDVKTKWTSALLTLSTYIPPPEQTMSLLERGGIDAGTAATYWADHGVPTDVVTAFTTIANNEIHHQDRLEAKGDILNAYYDGIITHDVAQAGLNALGYRAGVADDILAIQDFRREIRAIDQVTRRISTLYGTFKISAVDAHARLAALGIPALQATGLLNTWEQLRIAPVRVPTTAEIGRAVKAGTITEQEGLAELAALGYQARDAAIVLSSESGAAVTPLPPAGTTVTG